MSNFEGLGRSTFVWACFPFRRLALSLRNAKAFRSAREWCDALTQRRVSAGKFLTWTFDIQYSTFDISFSPMCATGEDVNGGKREP